MILSDSLMNGLKRFEKELLYAVDNDGRGAFLLTTLRTLEDLYFEASGERVCGTCNRLWLWRLGVWYKETLSNGTSKKKRGKANTDTV